MVVIPASPALQIDPLPVSVLNRSTVFARLLKWSSCDFPTGCLKPPLLLFERLGMTGFMVMTYVDDVAHFHKI